MKKLMLILVALVAVPAMAVVEFDAVDNGDGTVTISYTTTEGELPRGIALNLLTDGPTLDSAVSWDCFNVFLDYAFDNSEGYAVGDGDPIADPAGPGVGTPGGTEIAVCMGYLDEDGLEPKGDPGPGECTDLITIAFTGTGLLTVSADTLRGPDSGVVGSELASNLPLVDIAIGGDPGCPGDLNASDTITSTDITLLYNYWDTNKNFLGNAPLGLTGYIDGMDLDASGGITSTDITMLYNWWDSNKNFLGSAPCMPAS